MKFTIAEWILIQAVICEELVRTSAVIDEMEAKGIPQGKTWPDGSKTEDFEYSMMKHRRNVLNNILTKLNNEEI
ncbi:hypothetical protein [Schwartzia succinivorans]|jgi:hypothetical protein|uniref:Uncharacterized protein n=1 Tax=Schwartzia succinivorans DSM 10502 TaxID=1123243 RepID=A0A1M4V0Q0_9FIRM|nr:hypothetical protein [Schwartzia succinivorans]SHE62561.1 hypothetical protein SAMN02745190_00843 [Schwartzia succinivorans DSM 10502]